jgi:probable phosphoglycerate mutase
MTLSAQGREEAAEGAAAVSRFCPDVALSSDFLRALETAEIATAGASTEIQLAPNLRERVFYSLVGKSFPEIVREHGDAGRGILEGNSDLVDLPGEEGYSDARRRVVDFLKELCRVAAGSRVLVVSHGGPHAWLLEETLGVDLRGVRSFTLRTGFFSRFTIQKSGFRIDSMNVPPVGVAS